MQIFSDQQWEDLLNKGREVTGGRVPDSEIIRRMEAHGIQTPPQYQEAKDVPQDIPDANLEPQRRSIWERGLGAMAGATDATLGKAANFLFERTGKFIGTAVGRVGEAAAFATMSPEERQRALLMSPEEFKQNFPFLGRNVDEGTGTTIKKTAGEALGAGAELSTIATGVPGAATAGGRIASAAAIGGASGASRGLMNDESAGQIAAKTALGAGIGAATAGVVEGVKALRTPKVAEVFTSVPKEKFDEVAAIGPQNYKNAQKFLDEPANMAKLGKSVYDDAASVHEAAMNAWKASAPDAMKNVDAGQATALVQSDLADAFKTDRVDFEGGKWGAFRANDGAKRVLQTASEEFNTVAADMPTDPAELIVKRQTVANVDTGTDRTAGMVKGRVLEAIDKALSEVGGKGYAAMRAEYAKTAGPALDIMGAMEKDGQFSADKASAFLKQAMSDFKFDNKEALAALDQAGGTNFLKQVRALGAAKAVSALTPPTASRVADVLKTFLTAGAATTGAAIAGPLGAGAGGAAGLATGTMVASLFSPAFWGQTLVNNPQAQQAGLGLMTKLMVLALEKMANTRNAPARKKGE